MRKYRQDKEYDPEQLRKGTEHELDDKHTKSRVEAKRIAKDHLDDDPEYYSKLEKFDLDEKKKRKKAGTESSKESSLRDWFKRKGAKGKKGGWVDCNAPDGKGGYKSCGRSKGEKRKRYPACRPTPGACKERGRGKSWGKKGSKKKRNENMQLTTEEIKKIIQEELEAVLSEKKDACYKKIKAAVKRKGGAWPSAYASGRLVQCRKKGAANWNEGGSKKNENLDEEFKQHDMFDPKTRKKKVAKVEKDHHDLAKKGYTHIDPQDILDLIDKEGGALGMKNLTDKFGEDKKAEILKTIKAMSDVGQHEEGDYIRADDKEIDVVKEAEMEEAKKKKPCKPAKGKRFAKRVNGKCRSFGQAGKAKGGGDRIRPGTKKGDAYCARSAKIKKCKNPPCANDLSRKKWKCRGSKSMREEKGE
ncbi:MAG: DUF5661 family protein [Candidatus Hodarchaeales archaeon]|jgi:hypothetical protein